MSTLRLVLSFKNVIKKALKYLDEIERLEQENEVLKQKVEHLLIQKVKSSTYEERV